jgi:hypothetical protein
MDIGYDSTLGLPLSTCCCALPPAVLEICVLLSLLLLLFIYLFILTANWFLRGGSGTTVMHNTQITHITQNNTPHCNKTQHAKLHRH